MEARTVIVGDVHGCSEELEALIERVGHRPTDRWVFVGDLVARGPDSRGVLRLARSLRAKLVVGNHEQRLLDARERTKAGGPARLSAGHAKLFEALEPQDWALLEGMLPYLELASHNVVVVHAGVDARLPWSAQRLEVLTTMRSLEAGEPSERFKPESWAASYPGPVHVVFGHNARLGLQVHLHATGLDSGCVYGGALSALVLDAAGQPAPPQTRAAQVVQVPALRRYFTG